VEVDLLVIPEAKEGKAEIWYTEYHTDDLKLSLRVKRFLHTELSRFQRIDVFESHEFGVTLALDSRIQTTERDEFCYHEMLVHPAMMTHPNPERVLIIGGGDGGAAREVLKHPTVKRVVQVELDERVVEVSKKYMPFLSASFSDPRHQLVIGDGFDYLENVTSEFDVVIVDSTDPIGEAKKLFTSEFYSGVKDSLREGGIAVGQAETPFLYPTITKGLYEVVKQVFSNVKLYLTFVPSYQSGMWSFVMGSDGKLEVDRATLEARYRERGLQTKFYNPGVHLGLSELPNFLKSLLGLE